jgi:hypothetical protein
MVLRRWKSPLYPAAKPELLGQRLVTFLQELDVRQARAQAVGHTTWSFRKLGVKHLTVRDSVEAWVLQRVRANRYRKADEKYGEDQTVQRELGHH